MFCYSSMSCNSIGSDNGDDSDNDLIVMTVA